MASSENPSAIATDEPSNPPRQATNSILSQAALDAVTEDASHDNKPDFAIATEDSTRPLVQSDENEELKQSSPAKGSDEDGAHTESAESLTSKDALPMSTRQGKAKSKIPQPVLLQPLCARELLLSRSCNSTLTTNNSIKGKIFFVLIVITLVVFLVGHVLTATLTLRWSYERTLRLLQAFDFPHVQIPCAVIKDLDTTQKNLVFHDMPYASFSRRFEESNFMETFLDCYQHYFLAQQKAMASFKNGAFFWSYKVMTKIRSDRTAWRQQLKQPDSTETVGSGESVSLSVVTPHLNNGSRPVLVLVTGNDFVFNKPILPPAKIVESLDCVVVSVNYRIGLDGAAILDRDNFMGNQFARDVTQALVWINHTIDSFGGDAKRVIYFGEGSGGTLGLWLMLAPEAVFVNKFWLMDPSVEIPPLTEMGSIVEDIFLKEPSPLATNMSQDQISECYKQFKHKQPADCLDHITLPEVIRVTPQWLTEAHKYLDEYPEKMARQVTERSLLHLPPSMLNSSLLATLREKRLKLADRSVVFFSSIASNYYWPLFPTGRRNESRFKVETGLRRSLERVYAKRDTRKIGSIIVQHYVDFMKAEISEDKINYEDLRRLLLYDIRTVCPVQALLYHLLIQKVISAPMYNILDISSYQSLPILVGDSDLSCNLPRFLMHSFDDDSLDACRIAFDIGEEGRRQLQDYRAAAIGILADFAHGRVRDVHHKQHLVAAVGSGGSDAFEASLNILDHRGNQPGMDTRRSQHIKSVCHELYGSTRNDWHVLLYMARYN